MSIHITIHEIDKVLVRNCTNCVTVEFSTPTADSVSLFFPDHAAVQQMLSELSMSVRDALAAWGATPDKPTSLPAR